jgi:3D (Asp-Asp-Asp) domain-containing protein
MLASLFLVLSLAGSEDRTMTVTAYCPCRKCCGPNARGITASGRPVTANGVRFVAADKMLPFGTIVAVPGYGTVPVLDRGGAIKGRRLDVFFPTHAEALVWGRQTLVVRIWRK